MPYIYKHIPTDNTYKLIDYTESTDKFEIEERIIKLIHSVRAYRDVGDITVYPNGYYTVYKFIGGDYDIVVSDCLLKTSKEK